MDPLHTHSLARKFLETLGSHESADDLALLCAPDLDWVVPGDVGAFPWIGRKKGRQAIVDFIRDTQAMIDREALEVDDILASEARAVIVGRLKSRVKATGRLIEGEFAIVLTFAGDLVERLLLLEDSHAVSEAARSSPQAGLDC